MARDILSEYGPNSPDNQKPRATSGGQMHPRDVRDYEPPTGPKYINTEGPGLRGGINHGNCGTQGRH